MKIVNASMQSRLMVAATMFGLGLTLAAAAAAGSNDYEVINHWTLGGTGKWDYLIVDVPHHHLFLSRSTHVQVVDLASGALAGDITDTPGVHGIALAADLNRGFISNGKGDSVTVFDLETLARVGQIKLSGSDPDAIIYDAFSKHVYAFNGHSNNASIIDASTAREIGTLALPGGPEFAVSDAAGHVFVNIEDKGLVAVIDVAKGSVQATWALAPCVGPTGIALDTARHRLFSVCHNQHMIVTDSETGRRVADLPIGKHVDAAAFDPATSLVFSSNGDSADVTVIAAEPADRYVLRGRISTAPGSKTMALDAETHRLYIPANSDHGFEVLVAAQKN